MKKHKHKLITLTILLAMATGIIHVINRIIATSAILKDLLRTSEKNFYNWRFGRIYYTKQGKGSPILLIHDLTPGGSGYEWNRIESQLSTNHTVYTIDLLGCGRSDKPSITYTNFIYVQMLSDFIKNIIGEKTDVIASGFSGSFTIMACHNEKEYFNKIMLINPPSLSQLNQTPDHRSKILKILLEIPVFGTLIYHMASSQVSFNNLFVEKYYYNPFHIDPDMLDAYYEASHKGNAKFLYSSLIAKYINLNICHGLKNIDNSIFIVEGENEINGREILTHYTECNAAVETVILPHCKHFPHVEQPEKFMTQVSIFF